MDTSARSANHSTPRPAPYSAVGALIAMLCCAQGLPAWAAPAQVPLLTRSQNAAEPNVVFNFDDSGSMAWRFMPDATNISTTNSIRWKTTFHPNDTSDFGNAGSDTTYVIAARANDGSGRATDLVSARMRSSAYNTLYYNPEIRYRPWFNSDGTQFPNSPPAAAWLFPMDRVANKTVDLVGLHSFSSSTVWCRSDDDNDANTTTSADRNYSNPADETCATISSETFNSINETNCLEVGGAWVSNTCRLTSYASQTACQNAGFSWTSGSCRLSAINSTTCASLKGNWSSNSCKLPELLAPAVYYTYNGGGLDDSYSFSRVRIMDQQSLTRSSARSDCAAISAGTGSICTQAEEYQNFANWFTYYRTRNYLSIASASRAFSEQGSDLRVGYGRINKGSATIDGESTRTLERGVRDFAGADRTSFFTWLHGVPASGGTPLRRAMDDVGKYFQRSSNRGPWGNTPGTDDGADPTSHLQCRKSYHILMSDGYWNGDAANQATGNVDNTNGPSISSPTGASYQYVAARPYRDSHSDTLADAAMYYWHRDLRPDLPNRVPPDAKNPAFWQHMVNFTVGLGVDGTLNYPDDLAALQTGAKNWPQPGADDPENIDDLWHAAVNSRGEYLSAKDPEQFANSLSSILEEIVVRNASEGGVAAAAATLQAGNRKYVPEYKTAVWTGDLTAYELDGLGQQGEVVWKTSTSLPAHGARNIVAGTGNGTPKAQTFTWAGLDSTMKVALGADGSEALVNFLRGDASLEGGVYRDRPQPLGDFVNSQPVFVKGLVDMQYNALPDGAPGRGSYRGFVNDKKAREGVIFIGGNDGMLHAFRDTDGQEIFGFIPNTLLPALSALASPSYGHRYYVDGQLTESDAYIGDAWKNVLVGSLGAGGRGIFALDVTNMTAQGVTPGASNVMWELDAGDDAELGYVLSPIEVGRVRDGTWVAVFGNGPDSSGGVARLFVVNLETGAVIRKITAINSSGNALGGVRVIRDANRVIVGAYAGDLLGNVWKFDLSASSSASWGVSFSGVPLFSLGSGKPITAPPQYIGHPLGGYMVLVGSGKLYEEGDQSSTAQQRLYGLWDKQALINNSGVSAWSLVGGPITDSTTIVDNAFDADLVTGENGATYFRIDSQTLDWNVHRGWTLPLTLNSGHRNLLSPQLIFGFALFETMAPSAEGVTNPCDASANGVSYNLLINPLDGSQSATPIFDTEGDGTVDDGDTVAAGVVGVWDGRDVVLTERPCLVEGDCPTVCPGGTKMVSIQSAAVGNTFVCLPVPPPDRWWWRQLREVP